MYIEVGRFVGGKVERGNSVGGVVKMRWSVRR